MRAEGIEGPSVPTDERDDDVKQGHIPTAEAHFYSSFQNSDVSPDPITHKLVQHVRQHNQEAVRAAAPISFCSLGQIA